VVGEHAGHHRLAHRDGANADAGIVAALGDDLGFLAGAIDLSFADLSLAIPQMQGGTLRGIGVTSPKRNELTPDLPALAEAMPGFEATIWYGLLAPAGTPDAVVNKLYMESEKFLTMPETREKLAKVGVIVSTMPPAEFGSFIHNEIVRWTADAKAAGIEAQ